MSRRKSAVFCKSVVSQVPWELSRLPQEQRLVYVRNNHFFISILSSSWLSKVVRVPYQSSIIFTYLLCVIFFLQSLSIILYLGNKSRIILPCRPPKKYKLIPRTIKRNGGGKVISIDDDLFGSLVVVFFFCWPIFC